MKRVLAIVSLAAALGAGCERRHDTPAATAVAATTPRIALDPPAALRRPLFWAAEKDGRTTYFLGTMHLGVDAAAQLPALVWAKLDAARTFAMEADLDDPQLADLLAPTDRSLRRDLGEAYWHRLEEALGTSMAAAVDHLPAVVPASALSSRGLPATPAMDKVLRGRAAEAHERVVYLEPATFQLALLRKWLDVRALRLMLDELPAGEQRAHAMLAAYLAGDDQQIVALSDGERAEALGHGYTPAEYDREMAELLYDRNAAWIAAIEGVHAEGGGFVAVGALHLVGPRSVLELLARRGYRVTRLAP
jgi:uncharacterized protein